jgi:hypothetical protein
MYSYGIELTFWLKLLLFLVIVVLLYVSFNTIMRKFLNVERRKFFSYNHVNEKHKRIDWTIRIVTIVIIFFTFPINITRDPIDFWFLQPWFILFISLSVSDTVSAVMEWKYATNSNRYKLTIAQLIFNIILVITLIVTNFFGLV